MGRIGRIHSNILLAFAIFLISTFYSHSFSIQAGRFYAFQGVARSQQSTLLRSTREEGEGEVTGLQTDAPKPTVVLPVRCPDCDLCDGSGRIMGGLGTVLPWWPIKAYRPCPNFINSGGLYERAGQGLEEIAFGREE